MEGEWYVVGGGVGVNCAVNCGVGVWILVSIVVKKEEEGFKNMACDE